MKEIWKDIKGYEGLYQVSNMGNVKSLDRIVNHNTSKTGKSLVKGTLLKFKKDKDGYLNVCLYNNGNRSYRRVHRLVAEAFVPNPKNFPLVNHKDEVKDNNCVDNLEWCTYQYNNTYGTRIEKSIKGNIGKHGKKVRCITTGKEFNSLKEAGEYYKCHIASNIRYCIKTNSYCGKLPDGTPLYWEYID